MRSETAIYLDVTEAQRLLDGVGLHIVISGSLFLISKHKDSSHWPIMAAKSAAELLEKAGKLKAAGDPAPCRCCGAPEKPGHDCWEGSEPVLEHCTYCGHMTFVSHADEDGRPVAVCDACYKGYCDWCAHYSIPPLDTPEWRVPHAGKG